MEEAYDVALSKKLEELKNYYKKLINYVCDNQDAIDKHQKEKMEKTIVTITSLNPLLNSIQDKVFLKQLKIANLSSIDCKFNYGVDSIDDLMNSLKYDIDCVNKSKVPLWLSNTMYFFNHNWRKQVYQKIMITYSKIKDYLKTESEEDAKKANIEKTTCYKESKASVLATFSDLLKEMNKDIKNKPLNIN